jgi:8-oxo-dGTP pyrophosphatase MutT (NUDIX family)
MKHLLENWREFLNENKKPLFKKAKIKRYTDLALFAEAEEENMLGSAVVVWDEEGRVLILKRADWSHWMPLKWGLPGGLTDKGETPSQTAVREVREETSLGVSNTILFYISEAKVAYFTTIEFEGKVKLDAEHEEYAWAYPEELTNYDSVPRLSEMVTRAREALKHAGRI